MELEKIRNKIVGYKIDKVEISDRGDEGLKLTLQDTRSPAGPDVILEMAWGECYGNCYIDGKGQC